MTQATSDNPPPVWILDAGDSSSSRALMLTLALAAGLHTLLLLAVSFELPVPGAAQRTTRPLEVVVLRSPAPTDEVPEEADAYAQVNREGGGTESERTQTDRRKIEQTPEPPPDLGAPLQAEALPPEPVVAPIPAPPPEPVAEVPPLAEPPLTASVDSLEAAAPEAPPETRIETPVELELPPEEPIPEPLPELAPVPTPRVTAAQIMASRSLEIAKLTAKIEEEISAYANRPRRKAISASTREYKYASYLEAWRRKVEQVGNLNYPEEAKQQRLYGSLILHVALRSDGSLEAVRVLRSSGFDVLDEAAVRIVELAAPYSPFPPGIKAETDVLDITRTWQFLSNNRLGWEN